MFSLLMLILWIIIVMSVMSAGVNYLASLIVRLLNRLGETLRS